MSLLSPALQAFVAVTQEGTVHAAARRLGLTQTGVTQRLRSLETALATTLFTRSRKGMTATPEGQALLRYCQAARDLEGEVLARLESGGLLRPVRVHVTGPTSIMRSRVIPACLGVLGQYPQLAATFEIDDLDSREEGLRSGRAQLAVLSPERVAREMDSKLLKPERYVLVGAPAWKRRPLERLVREERIVDFDDSDPLSFEYLKSFGLLQSARADRHFVNQNEALVEFFRAGLGYGVLTAEFAAPYLRRRELALLNGGRELVHRQALAWYPRPRMPAYFAALIAAVH